MIDAGAWASARGRLYRYLAAAFLKPPADTFVMPFLNCETLETLGRCFGANAVTEIDRFRQAFDSNYEALDQEYQSLFVAPLGRYVTPYEAVYRDERVVEDTVVRGLLMGPSTVAVKALYREAGAEVAEDLLELPDHVGLELGCMHFLCEAEARARLLGDRHAAERAQHLQRRLLEEHLLQWVPALCRRIRENAPGPFYRGIADLTEALVSQDAEAPAAGPKEVSQGR
jgi:putative dimethyl sulfoxide reductase chaperone